MLVRTLFTFLILGLYSSLATYIVPGGRWRDTDGNIVNAHGGCVIWDDPSEKYFMFGEYKTEEVPEGGGFSVYSSTDLAHWTFLGKALNSINDSTLLAPGDRVQRPKVFYQENQFHMWFASDNSSLIKLQGYATSPNITGPYTYQGSFRPFGDGWSSDYGQFRDFKTGQMYVVYAGGFNGSVSDDIIATFNEQGDGLEAIVYDFKGTSFEGPTVVQTDQSYWFVGSHKTGYRPNNVIAMRSDSLAGPWSQPNLIAPRDTRTFSSQSGFNLRIEGTKQTAYIYMGDRWSSPRIWDSRLLWLPIQIDEDKKTLNLEWHDVYHLDVKTGEWWPIEGTTYFSKDATVAGDAFHQEANFGSNLTIVTGIYGNDSTVTFNGIKGCGKKQWVSFWYQNTDDVDYGDNPGSGNYTVERISSVVVNGDTSNVETLVQLDTWKGVLLSTPLELDLSTGDNTITISGLWNGDDYKGGDIDRIVVYPPEHDQPRYFAASQTDECDA